MTPERAKKFRKVVKNRQANLTLILENVHDVHNIGAVLRTSDAVGIKEIFVLYTEEHLKEERITMGGRSSSGARKWIDVHYYTDLEACFKHVKKDYQKIYSTHLATDSVELYDLNLAQSVALLFGNEKDGVSKEALTYSDGNFIIPQMGMVQSLNISVACAVSLYEAYRQRKLNGNFDDNPVMNPEQQEVLFQEYERRHINKISGRTVKKKA